MSVNLQNKIFKLKESRRFVLTSQSNVLTNNRLTDEERNTQLAKLQKEEESINEELGLLEKLAIRMQDSVAQQQIAEARTATAEVVRNEVRSSLAPFIASSDNRVEARARRNAAFHALLSGTPANEVRDLVTSADVQGQAVIPQEYNDTLTIAQKNFAPILDFANVVRGGKVGAGTRFATVNDTTAGLVDITEGSVTLTETDPSFLSQLTFCDLLSGGIVRVSNQLLSDSHFDFGTLFSKLAAARVYRGIEKAVLVGKDNAGAALTNNAGVLSWATPAVTTATLAAGVTYANLEDTFNEIDVAYLPTSYWLMAQSTRNAVAKLVDTAGRPVVVLDPRTGFETLMGRPILIANSLPSLATANALPILFGSLEHSVGIALSDIAIAVSRERFAEVNETMYSPSIRVGSTSLITSALTAVKNAAA